MKVFAYIDGFNIYHYLQTYIRNGYNKSSGLDIEDIKEFEKNKLKWCNIKKLISFFVEENTDLHVKFFTAFPLHRDSGQKRRHNAYMNVLQNYCGVSNFGKICKKTEKI